MVIEGIGLIDLLYKAAAFLVALGLLVTFHELGHYAVARLARVKILRFSLGFGHVIWSRRFGVDQTEWAVSAIPLGGYVKMLDEREGQVVPAELPRAFNRQSVWKRIAIVAAGPCANLLLAVLLFAATYVSGVPGQRATLSEPPAGTAAAEARLHTGDTVTAVDGAAIASWQDLRWRLLQASGAGDAELTVASSAGAESSHRLRLDSLSERDWESNFMAQLGLKTDLGAPVIADVAAGKPAAAAGIRAGDRILSIDGEATRSPADVAAIINAHPNTPLRMSLQRGAGVVTIALTPETIDSNGRKIGMAGLKLQVDPDVLDAVRVMVRYDPLHALAEGAKKTWDLSVFTLQMLKRIVTGEASLKNISGPLTMADYAGQSAQQGALTFVGYLALISISLGVLNLLPVPLLDGGHLLYYVAEIIKGSPVSDRAVEVGQRVGMTMLALLMALALFNDISRLL